jgi:N utilization substance protein B
LNIKETRHRARAAAPQILYQWEVGGIAIDRAIDTVLELQRPESETSSGELREFAAGLARDTVTRLPAIDPLIAATTERWRPERMAVIDRLILRMGACELARDRETPPAVVINEALELARTFSTEDSVKFINGMLDGIRKKIETPEV